jgi:competence protein ComEC
MLPLMARDFHRVALAAPIVNLVAVPMIGFLVPFGFFGTPDRAAGPVFGGAVSHTLGVVHVFVAPRRRMVCSFSPVELSHSGPAPVANSFVFATGVVLAREIRCKHSVHKMVVRVACLVLLLSTLTVALYPFSPTRAKGKLEVSVLDVGQGDSLFVVSPRGKTLLIDGGGAFGGYAGKEEEFGIDPGQEAVSPNLWSRGFQKLDVVALTHAHQDHLGGLRAILENFRVGELWIGREVSSPALRKLEELAKNQGIKIEHQLRGKSSDWDGVRGEFLWPETAPSEIASVPKNDDSLVLKLKYGHESILLPGDAEGQTEQRILAENDTQAMRSDVLKIGHHGGKNSTTPEFLAAVHPRIGIVSVGEKNPYGHPSPELLDRLKYAGVQILRTDRDGAVRVLTDGEQIVISCFVACLEASGSGAVASAQTKSPDHQQSPQQE